jgi:excisionase family DNA binding protein
MNRLMPGDLSEEPVLDKEALAARLRVSVRSVLRLLASGRGPRVMRIGRLVRFRLAEVERWERQLEKRSGTTSAQAVQPPARDEESAP